MKIKKDLVASIAGILWLTSNIVGYAFYKDLGALVSNFVCIGLFGGMVLLKLKNRKFGLWLEEPLLKSST